MFFKLIRIQTKLTFARYIFMFQVSFRSRGLTLQNLDHMIPSKLTLSEFQRCFVKIYYMPHTIFCFHKSHCFQKNLKKNPCLLGTHKFDCPLFLLWHYHTHFIGMTVLHNCFHKSHFFKNYHNYLVSIDWIWWCPLSLVASSYIPTLFFILLGWLTSILPVKCINFPLSDSESLLWQWSTRVKPGT